MGRRAAGALAVFVLLAGLAMPALAAVEREDIIMLGADGYHFTSYKTLRSDLAGRLLYLGPDETPGDALFIVPSHYKATRLDDGGTRLYFPGGNYAIMNAGRFSRQVSQAKNGDLIFSSWDGITRDAGHLGKWNAPGDFASFAYSWIVPANIEFISYRANRAGQWQRRGSALSWHGEQVNDIVFTIRYRVSDLQIGRVAPAPETAAPVAKPARLPLPERQPMSGAELKIAPATSLAVPPAPAPPDVDDNAKPKDTPTTPRSVTLNNVVVIPADGRPLVTARGHRVLDRLAGALAANNAERITVTGPDMLDSRDTGGSVAQAARVSDYLASHGINGERIEISAGEVQGKSAGRTIEITVIPGSALGDFSAGE